MNTVLSCIVSKVDSISVTSASAFSTSAAIFASISSINYLISSPFLKPSVSSSSGYSVSAGSSRITAFFINWRWLSEDGVAVAHDATRADTISFEIIF